MGLCVPSIDVRAAIRLELTRQNADPTAGYALLALTTSNMQFTGRLGNRLDRPIQQDCGSYSRPKGLNGVSHGVGLILENPAKSRKIGSERAVSIGHHARGGMYRCSRPTGVASGHLCLSEQP